MCSRRIVSCCSDLALINVARLSAGRQQLSPSPAWHRLFRSNSGVRFALNDRTLMLGCAVWRDTSSRVVIYWNIGRSARFTFAEEVSTGQLPSPAPSYDGFVTA